MIRFFQGNSQEIFVVQSDAALATDATEKLEWLFNATTELTGSEVAGDFVGPRKEMITPWSTNAVEITQNMGIEGILRIEEFTPFNPKDTFDPMLQSKYKGIDQNVFTIENQPVEVLEIDNISDYSKKEGLALSQEEVEYLEKVSSELGRKLTDGEVFGFSQVNSEHCRHKIFNGVFVIDGVEKPMSLFKMIKKTSEENPDGIVSAYKDNVAFVEGSRAQQFAPASQDKSDYFEIKDFDSVISLKAETHNFPTTVEPFNGAATGAGGEIRDRMAGGKASMPLAGTAVYMTSYPRLSNDRAWESKQEARPWLYQTPLDILIKASNGASDFGNKFGQPLIAGSLLTFEHDENGKTHGFDKVIMLAGGIGIGKKSSAIKATPKAGDKIVVMGGDNYRIGMGGSAVSSVATGEFSNSIELNAIQRSNPEMQKRVSNTVRAMAELDVNPIVSIHDHGAGGHLNCLSELIEDTGGTIDVSKLPLGDPTLSDKEIIGNESQERMGLVIDEKHLSLIENVAKRERAPFYLVGEATGDMNFQFVGTKSKNPIDWKLSHMFGSSPKTVMADKTISTSFEDINSKGSNLSEAVKQVLKLEAVACKDWLTNKVDRSVTGRVAKQQTTGKIQLPLNNVGVMAMDFTGQKGIATAIGHAPVAALSDAKKGSILSISEALTNIIWAPITNGLAGVSLSANWMWPCKNEGEDARLYEAVSAVSDFACALGINIPTGKDSLSMTQKYPDGKQVMSPGTVIISSGGQVENINKVVEPALKPIEGSSIIWVDFSGDDFKLGGSSFAQSLGLIGNEVPTVSNPAQFKETFNIIQSLILDDKILAGHDISSGGMVTALLEMTFPTPDYGISVNLDKWSDKDINTILFNENPGVLLQAQNTEVLKQLKAAGVNCAVIGEVISDRKLAIEHNAVTNELDIDSLRDAWFETSYLLDIHQSGETLAKERFNNYKSQPLEFKFPNGFDGSLESFGLNKYRKEKTGVKAAIIREKGVNGDREMAYAMYLAGFDVKDVHMTDLTSGKETLEDINFIVFVGGFSNSDVLGSAKGWAGAFLYNKKAKAALDNFYARKDTISLGVCNGCQLMMELGLLYPEIESHPKMHHNDSGKFESIFLNMTIPNNDSVMFGSMSGASLGVWVAHGEGKFILDDSSQVSVAGKYSYDGYPGNPNGSDQNISALVSKDGRHLAMMPHMERAIFPWNWAYYPEANSDDEVSPWMAAFVNARNWVKDNS